MACPRCGSTAPALQGRCASCGAALGGNDATVLSGVLTPSPDNVREDGETTAAPPAGEPSDDAQTVLASGSTPQPPGGTTPRTPSGSTLRGASGSHGPLQAGQDFGGRYHLIRLLGVGGMGAVYQAWDKTLEVAVAIKVIRLPETMDAHEAQAAERRFKRELLLARQVTHRNVVRIHDLGEIDGITYITMPYVQGSDLATTLKREGRMPAELVIGIARQVAAGLVAAHEAGVVHRDLKPANIMVTADGEALIMDFGIARATTGNMAMTMTPGGAVVGTIEFMAPEQARGLTVDQRADIYAFGLILNDLLLGRRQHSGTTAVAELMDRMQRAPASVRSIDPTVPPALDALITRCVQPDPLVRYQRMIDVLADLGGEGRTSTATLPLTLPVTQPYASPTTGTGAVVVPPRRLSPWVVAGAAVVVVLGAGVFAFRDRLFTPKPVTPATAPAGPTISLAILPFRNTSGDATLNSLGASLSEVLRTELGESARLRTVPSNRMHQVLQDLRISSAASLAPADLNRIADYTNARRVLWGTYERFGSDAIRINATLQDLDQNVSVPLNSMAQNGTSASLLAAVADLADKVRADIAKDAPDVLSELKKTSWKPSTNSMEAMQLYSAGVLLTQEGAHQEARKRFEAATQKDPNFALAFSALARSSAALAFDDDAVRFSGQAMTLSDGLPAQEKYLIAANNYWITGDSDKAIEAYENLAKASPNSASVLFDLGELYEQTGELEKAQQKFETVVKLDPKFVEGLLSLGRVEIKRGNPQASLDHLNAAKTLAINLNRDEARGNILQAIGIAYKKLNNADEALKNYRDALVIRTRVGNQKGMAGSLGEIAQIQEQMGNIAEAEQNYRAALKLQRQIGDKSGMSVTLANFANLLNEALGRPNDALPLMREALQIRRDAGNQAGEALVLNNIGNVYLAKGDFAEATTYFERALEIHEKTRDPGQLADTLHNLGETLSKRGKYDDALKRYLRALDLRRTAVDVRSAAIESYSIGTIFDYQGSFGRALKSKQDALKTFEDLKVRDVWHGEILSGYSNSLTLAGRMDEAKKSLGDAMTMAVELNNPSLIAQTARFQADRLYYSGDLKAAGPEADKAAQAAARASDRSLTLLAQATVARIAAATSPTAALAAKLATLSEQADALGLKSLAVECALLRAGTLLKIGQLQTARQEIDRTLTKAETLGFRLLAIKAHYLLAEVLRANKAAGATAEYALVLRLLNQIVAEEGNAQAVKRTDLAAVQADSERWSKG